MKINNLNKLLSDFNNLRDQKIGQKIILNKLKPFEVDKNKYLAPWYKASDLSEMVYPSQGLMLTPFDDLPILGFKRLTEEKIIKTLRLRMFFLEMFNHPLRIKYLNEVTKAKFNAPKKIESKVLNDNFASGLTLSIRDVGSIVTGGDHNRVSRSERYSQGPFVKLGRQARTLFVGSASPDVWASSFAVATMAASLSLAGIPRNGVLSDVKRQAEMAKEVFSQLDSLAEVILKGRSDKNKVLGFWRKNVMGVIEARSDKAIIRAQALYKAGVRSFRVYSPEPGSGPVDTVKFLRKHFNDEIEIFTGQIVDVRQAKNVQEAGADGIYVGIGGGGRCITGVRSGSVIDWPELLWSLRGEITIPVIVEGGASDHVATTLLLGASGIGVSRVVAGGTIESPGGVLFCVNKAGKLFKPYGGEASARIKYADGKLLPFGLPSFVEGEIANAEVSLIKNVQPTLTYNLHLLTEDAILALVFRGVNSVSELQAINPSPLRRVTSLGRMQMFSH